jgi:hypothetical protein
MTGALNMGTQGINAIGAGTAALPSVTWELSNATGIYQVNATTLGISANGQEKLQINPSGINVFGTVVATDITATGNLTVDGVFNAAGNISIGGDVIANSLIFGPDQNQLYQAASNNAALRIGTGADQAYLNFKAVAQVPLIGGWDTGFTAGNVERMRITNGGSVGIGITAPAAELHVKGSDSGIHFGASGGTLGIRISCRPTEAALEAVDAGLITSYQTLTLAGSGVLIKEGVTTRAQFGGSVCQFFGGSYFNGNMTQQVDNGEIRQMGSAGQVGFRFINTSAGGALGRSVWQGTKDGFGTVWGTGFTYDPSNLCVRPEADANLDIGSTSYRFRNASFSGNIAAGSNIFAGVGGSVGQCSIMQGNSSALTGYVGFYDVGSNLQGYIGNYGAGQAIVYTNNNGNGHNFTGGDIRTGNNIYGSHIVAQGSDGGVYANARDGTGDTYLFYTTGGIGRIWASSTGRECRIDNQGRWLPGADGVSELGTNGQRWLSVWSVNSSLQTSDVREKKWRGGLNEYEVAAAKELVKEIGIYQWLRDLVDSEEPAKLQCGITAQKAMAIFHDHGLNALAYGFVRFDEWDERTDVHPETGEKTVVPGGNRYSIMFPDILAFMMVGQEQRLDALEAKVEYLSGYGKRSDP